MKILEDWLDNPKLEYGFQKIVTKIAREEHLTKLLRNFSWEAEQMMTAALKHAKEEETGSMDFADPYEELEALERRGMVQILHIRQVNLEADQEVYQQKQSCQKKMGLHN